jgi:formylglycine-generating enzyme required for sulfatase activity
MKPLLVPGAVVAIGAGYAGWRAATTPAISMLAVMVTIPVGPHAYRTAGQLRLNGKSVDPPLERPVANAPLKIMKHPVGRADYAACMAGGACLPTRAAEGAELPQTDVSWHDAGAYARWFSRQTRMTRRLPSDVEWQRAAAERFVDDAVGMSAPADPAQRWLAGWLAGSLAGRLWPQHRGPRRGRTGPAQTRRLWREFARGRGHVRQSLGMDERLRRERQDGRRRRGAGGDGGLRRPHRRGPSPRGGHRFRT